MAGGGCARIGPPGLAARGRRTARGGRRWHALARPAGRRASLCRLDRPYYESLTWPDGMSPAPSLSVAIIDLIASRFQKLRCPFGPRRPNGAAFARRRLYVTEGGRLVSRAAGRLRAPIR